MKIYQALKTDTTAEVEGVWGLNIDGAKFKIARFNNPVFNKDLEKGKREHKHLMDNKGNLPSEIAVDVLCRTMSRTILMDWENVQDNDGKDIPFSQENAYNLLSALKDFRDLVTAAAFDMELFRVENLKATAKNSEATSAGSSKSASTQTGSRK